MNRPQQVIVEQALKLASELPPEMIEMLASSVEQARTGWAVAKGPILTCLSQPHYRALAADMLRAWEEEASGVTPQAVALALLTAGEAERRRREEQSVELVWTGPDAEVIAVRQTEQAILQVINEARESLLLVSYAVYRIPRICEAMLRAASRGVALRIVVEASDAHGGSSVRAKLHALGDAVARRAAVYYWPADRRPRDEEQNQGVLHVKAAVADGTWLLLTSANLTENAFLLNMELGLLVRGGVLPGQVEAQFGRLIETGQLRVV
jgi:phosphatidylserine/phosphatidylglycerophosphate/cardiolipin synthase-like enzyme